MQSNERIHRADRDRFDGAFGAFASDDCRRIPVDTGRETGVDARWESSDWRRRHASKTTTTTTIESKGIRDDDMILVTMKHAHMERTHGPPRGSSSMTMGAGQPTERGTGGQRDVATNHTDEENKSVMDLMANLKREIEFGGGFKVPPELKRFLERTT